MGMHWVTLCLPHAWTRQRRSMLAPCQVSIVWCVCAATACAVAWLTHGAPPPAAFGREPSMKQRPSGFETHADVEVSGEVQAGTDNPTTASDRSSVRSDGSDDDGGGSVIVITPTDDDAGDAGVAPGGGEPPTWTQGLRKTPTHRLSSWSSLVQSSRPALQCWDLVSLATSWSAAVIAVVNQLPTRGKPVPL